LIQVQIAERELREESRRRSERETFLSMLTHELRNPLGVIRLVADTKSPGGCTIEKAAQDMAGVVERVE
jgi:signal transduction histidine kinase